MFRVNDSMIRSYHNYEHLGNDNQQEKKSVNELFWWIGFKRFSETNHNQDHEKIQFE